MGVERIRLVLSRRLEELPVDRQQWNALVAETAGASIFQTYEWFECWWTALAGRNELFVVTLWDGQVPVGIAPLMIVRRTGLRRLEFVGSPNADYQDFILGSQPEPVLAALATFLATQRRAWDMMALRNLPTESVTSRVFPGLLNAVGIDTTDDERIACPTLEIAAQPDEIRRRLDAYSFRRRIRRLSSLGELKYTRCSTTAELERYLPSFFAQYSEQRAGSAAARFLDRPEVREFYSALARVMLPQGCLHFSVLECGGRPVSFHFGFEYGGRLYWYKPCYDPAVARMSPGKVLLSYLIRDAVDRDLIELDFTVGAEPFKYRYTRTQRTNVTLRAFSARWLYRAFRGVAWTRRQLSRWSGSRRQ
jgi:CelD/BcsL family acetyltransferase involved in cellulose biosynthesis